MADLLPLSSCGAPDEGSGDGATQVVEGRPTTGVNWGPEFLTQGAAFHIIIGFEGTNARAHRLEYRQ